ncbi:M1 family aminopeptidase [Maribacter polysaccharolyticus]|uniref:M1 family aminopeptidase n=1 Tax=Maribacter polysaccharolyticus TaxID=3020831 RepID=UPI00237F0567|nr:M1 family aminopeptidase [Maribacter polysaccharolyticus]MDE3740578.1 metalloprotease [Maribacter polysaccharolyticus]
MKKNVYINYILGILAFVVGIQTIYGQHTNILSVQLNGENKELSIQQEFIYVNSSKYTLEELYFNDWAHAYSNKNTGLAKRFAQEFKKSLHLAKDDERGRTTILSAVDDEYRGLFWERTEEKDLLKITLNKPLYPGEQVKLFMTYTVKLPPDKYTTYGYTNRDEYYLKDWYLSPAVFNGEWNLYSNKNLEDLYTDITHTTVHITYPGNLFLTTNYRNLGTSNFPKENQTQLEAIKQKNCEIILSPFKRFTTHVTPYMTVVTDLQSPKYDKITQGISIAKVSKFIFDNLGKYPHAQLLVSQKDYNKSPLYGLNQLPYFIRPYEEQFQFEMKFLKTALNKFLTETLYLNPRKEQWLKDAIANYLMIDYVETFYPDQKLLGKLSNIWGIRGFNLAKMDFNEQYPFLYMLTARKNLDQALTTPNDSLIKFNQKIANKYKAGMGLSYLADYIGKEKIDNSIKTYFKHYSLNSAKVLDFESIIKRSTDTDIDWFFRDYLSTDKKIDFKIKKITKTDDSLRVTLKNKEGTNVPISLFGIKKDSVVSKYWFTDIKTQKTFTIPRGNEDRMVLNYDHKIPEFNERDNWKSLKGFFSSNKKLQFRFFKDAEDPYYNQVFYVPVINFNIYDGWSPGMRIYNKTFLEKPFVYDFAPSYAFKEKSLVGYGKFNYRKYLSKSGLYVANYGLRGSTSHYQTNSRYTTITPSISYGWRPEDLRSNERDFLSLRFVNVFRTLDENVDNVETDPDYSVLNARFTHSVNGIIDYFSWFADAQYSKEFSKLSFELEYRKLFENNRQFNFRFFAGKFLRNTIAPDEQFFDFALDRPNDYLFDYNYLGRSEETGLYSQQIIIAEGGFKSKLKDPFSNDWMATANTSINIWKWIEFYSDVGFLKRKKEKERLVYDSGIRLNLVTDYFELYFPLYSNNGWEVSQPNYEEKIRFIVTLSPKTLTGLFTRKWF